MAAAIRSLAFDVDTTWNTTNTTQVGWVNESNGRGTLNILVSCISSLFLSTWAVMHLNIPKKHASSTRRVSSYFYWCIFGIFGPEMVIWTAWRQLLSAWALRDELRAISDTWTITHGFYTLMGGFAIDLDQAPFKDKDPLTHGLQRLTLTPKELLLLARCGHLPDISKEEIMDKSKVDELGKALACTQVLWMIAQVIARMILHLPVTTLEVTTVSHITCALALYALWWYKPRKIDEPTVLKGDWLRPLAAFMLMCSRESQGQMLPGFQLKGELSEIAGLELCRVEDEVRKESQHQEHCNPIAGNRFNFKRKYSTAHIDRVAPGKEASITLTEVSSSHPSYILARQAYGITASPAGMITLDDIAGPSNEATKVRWALAQEAITSYSAVQELLRVPHDLATSKFQLALATYPEMPDRCKRAVDRTEMQPRSVETSAWLECDTQHLVTVVASNWPHDGLLRTTSGLWIGACLWIVSILFSSIHIAAWHAAFPTAIEAWLWRSASLYIAFSGLLWAGLHILAEYWVGLWWTWYDIMIGDAPGWLLFATTSVCGTCGTAYLLSRAYLIIEAFISLRWLPIAVYQVPQWTLAVPHVA